MLPGRTTAAAIAKIVEVDSASWPDLDPFIDVANELVTEVCASVLVPTTGVAYYTSYRLGLIELWLAAHFYAITDQQVQHEKVTGLVQTYQVKVDLGFNQTKYGQQAMRLDTKGGLAALNNRSDEIISSRGVSVVYLGKTDIAPTAASDAQ